MLFSSFNTEIANKRRSLDAEDRGFSASVELGWALPALSIGESSRAALRFEPRVQTTWFGAGYDDVATDDGDRVAFGGENTVETQLGLRSSFEIPVLSEALPYAEVNWVHRTKATSARINATLESREAGAENFVEAAVGSNLALGKSLAGYDEVRIRKGHAG